MFACNERITLTVVDIYDKNGKQLPIFISFPLLDEELILPKNIVKLSIVEYHEGKTNYSHHAFNIYVGESSTIAELICEKVKININDMFNAECKNSKIPVVYFKNVNNEFEIFALVEGTDIVVANTEELKKVLKKISDEFTTITNSVNKIRKLSYNVNDK